MNRTELAYAVSLTVDGFADDYDIDAIVDEILETHGQVHIDDIDSDEYWAIVERHDTTA